MTEDPEAVKTSVRRVYAALTVTWAVLAATSGGTGFLYGRWVWVVWYIAAAGFAAVAASRPRSPRAVLVATVFSVVGFVSRAAMIAVSFVDGRGGVDAERAANGVAVWVFLSIVMWGYGHAAIFAAVSPPTSGTGANRPG